MRLCLTSAVAVAATLTLTLAVTPSRTQASPLNWPDDGAPMALHCAAVLQAYGHAYELAAGLTGQPATPMETLPAPLLQLAGGDTRLPEIALQAEEYNIHAESVARTSFYPRLVGDGTPYLADDGRELVMAVQTCVTQFGL